MRNLNLTLIILTITLLISCGESTSSDQTINTPQKSETKPPPKETLDLTKYGIANNPENVLGGLSVGDKAPDFEMLDQDGNQVSLEATLKEGPALLVFLRAEWCSFCVRHLKEFQDNIKGIHEAGKVKVIAVSPQKKFYMKKFHQENEFSFPILHDQDHSVMKDYKVFFHVTEKYNAYIKKAKGESIEVFNGNEKPVMPIPATYLINQDQTISYVHYDPNYKKRSDVKKIMDQF